MKDPKQRPVRRWKRFLIGPLRLSFTRFGPAEADDASDTYRVSFPIILTVVLGLVALAIACATPCVSPCLKHISYGVIWGFACLSLGFFAGFLFGLPRVLQNEEQSSSPAYRQLVNTNLQQISDWLTKIIVGLSIYQLDKIPVRLRDLGAMFASAVGQGPETRGVFAGAIVFFIISGFLLGYLVTRLYLHGALDRAQRPVPEGTLKTDSSDESKPAVGPEDPPPLDEAKSNEPNPEEGPEDPPP